jgi:flagellar hook assembly protein FlgD
MTAYPGIDFEKTSQLNSALSLIQNYPNPFTANTAIRYSIPPNTNAMLKIYDVAGKLIKSYQAHSGSQSVTGQFIWNRKDKNNHYVPSGVYYYTLTTLNNTITRKMVIY